jgi:hypothetical protein
MKTFYKRLIPNIEILKSIRFILNYIEEKNARFDLLQLGINNSLSTFRLLHNPFIIFSQHFFH